MEERTNPEPENVVVGHVRAEQQQRGLRTGKIDVSSLGVPLRVIPPRTQPATQGPGLFKPVREYYLGGSRLAGFWVTGAAKYPVILGLLQPGPHHQVFQLPFGEAAESRPRVNACTQGI